MYLIVTYFQTINFWRFSWLFANWEIKDHEKSELPNKTKLCYLMYFILHVHITIYTLDRVCLYKLHCTNNQVKAHQMIYMGCGWFNQIQYLLSKLERVNFRLHQLVHVHSSLLQAASVQHWHHLPGKLLQDFEPLDWNIKEQTQAKHSA